jgi:hypothetical protein
MHLEIRRIGCPGAGYRAFKRACIAAPRANAVGAGNPEVYATTIV